MAAPSGPREALQTQICDWWSEAQRARPDWYGGHPCPQLSANVGVVDAHSFLDGLRADPPIFSMERGYVLRTPLFPEGVRRRGGDTFHFFGRDGVTAPGFYDETIAHLGAISELVLLHDWPRELVICEPEGRGAVTEGALDALVMAPGGDSYFLGVEAKGDAKKLASLIKGINRCDGSGSHTRTDHKKCEAMLEFRPPYFWGVALGTRLLFRAEYRDGGVRLLPEPNRDILDYPG